MPIALLLKACPQLYAKGNGHQNVFDFFVSADPIALIFVKRAMGIFDSMGSLGGCFAALVVATKYGIFVLAVACMSIVQLIW